MKVLIAVEDALYGEAIVNYVAHHIWPPETTFRFIHVIEVTRSTAQIEPASSVQIGEQLTESLSQQGHALLTQLRQSLFEKLGKTAATELAILIGRPQERILETAEEWSADMIIMGSHGRRGASRFVMGSVSLSVVAHAGCGVTIIRNLETDGETKGKEHPFMFAAQMVNSSRESEAGSSELPTGAMLETGLSMYE